MVEYIEMFEPNLSIMAIYFALFASVIGLIILIAIIWVRERRRIKVLMRKYKRQVHTKAKQILTTTVEIVRPKRISDDN